MTRKNLLRTGAWALFISSLLIAGAQGSLAFQVTTGPGILTLVLRLPADYEFIEGAPFSLEFEPDDPETLSFPALPAGRFNPMAGSTKVPFTAREGAATVTIRATLFYCDKSSKMCLQKTHETRLTFEVTERGASSPVFVWDIVPTTDPIPAP
ncbi:MAG: hypothetical protein KTQ49_06585 [Candidatus Omnitrophica bacterium]|nr:hypothetical protein [Candidatus Omnitrophota bacterium]